ncbi:MAG TPA: hypothetical protein VKM94_14615 [Blastocatellia bacterium]|nr:hypothetical protein [Blastocatellia bacterium]
MIRPFDLTRQKRTTILVAFVFSAAIGPLDLLWKDGTLQSHLVSFLDLLVTCVLIHIWCYYDSLDRSESLQKWFRWVVFVLGPIALLIYLFRTRGPRRGLVATVRAVGLFAAFFLTMIVSGEAVTGLLGIGVPDFATMFVKASLRTHILNI